MVRVVEWWPTLPSATARSPTLNDSERQVDDRDHAPNDEVRWDEKVAEVQLHVVELVAEFAVLVRHEVVLVREALALQR